MNVFLSSLANPKPSCLSDMLSSKCVGVLRVTVLFNASHLPLEYSGVAVPNTATRQDICSQKSEKEVHMIDQMPINFP